MSTRRCHWFHSNHPPLNSLSVFDSIPPPNTTFQRPGTFASGQTTIATSEFYSATTHQEPTTESSTIVYVLSHPSRFASFEIQLFAALFLPARHGTAHELLRNSTWRCLTLTLQVPNESEHLHRLEQVQANASGQQMKR